MLLEDTPGNVALVYVFADDVVSIFCGLLLRLLKCTLIPVEAIEVNEFLLDQVALALVVAVAPTRNDWNLCFLQVS